MRLVVSEKGDDVSFDTIVVSPIEFNNITCHLYILSNDFDEVIVELSDKVSLGKMKPLMQRTKVIPKIVDHVNSHTISLLCELYPERSAELRYALIRNPESIDDKIRLMGEELGWTQFY